MPQLLTRTGILNRPCRVAGFTSERWPASRRNPWPASIGIRSVPLATIERLNRERTIPLNRYQADGAIDRFGYLENLAADHGVDFETILTLIDVLGPDEDFDGLVTTLEDLAFGAF